MNLKSVDLKREYRSLKDNLITDFYTPVLREAIVYKRAVGYFSSGALAEISKGISGLIKNGGKIKIIASPHLTEEDMDSIRKGYNLRDKVKERLLDSLEEPEDFLEGERLNLLSHLIANDRCDIKIAFLERGNGIGLYHEKIGIVADDNGNTVAFTGSLNETTNALNINYESIDVFTSWNDSLRVNDKIDAFNLIWNDREEGLKVLEFPEIKEDIIKKYKKPTLNLDIDIKVEKEEEIEVEDGPHIPKDVCLYDYQKEAIESWKQNNYQGIFDMATGTGKTYTGISAVCELYKNLSVKRLAIVIVCPFMHLVEQWVEDLNKFNIMPLVAYSQSKDKDYKRQLKTLVRNYNNGIINTFCVITTNSTYRTDFINENLGLIKDNALILIDEVHNFGSQSLGNKLLDNFEYRLGLSATIERHNDPIGTSVLYKYFGDKCIDYTLERAIQENKLTPYYYYPIVTYLTLDELDEYKLITKEIGKNIKKLKNGKTKLNEKGKILALKRARLIAGAINKIELLEDLIVEGDYINKKNILIYCGATTIDNVIDDDKDEIRQIDCITKLLGNKLNMKVSTFTSRENSEQRQDIKRQFSEGILQALVAIKCLDEGVNIPNIQTAFILASTTNPKEYIQRRGRVLRLAKGKEFSEIYDFITLPRELNSVSGQIEEEIRGDKTLILNELKRVNEFGRMSLNPCKADKLIDEIMDIYGLELKDIIEGEENEY